MTIAPYTPSTSTTPATGPDSAGLNPTSTPVVNSADGTLPAAPALSTQGYTLPDTVASKPLPGGEKLGATPGQAPRQYDEKQLIQELATYLDVKAPKGGSLEQGVVDALAEKYNVKIQASKPGGAGEGGVDAIRHNIASWFDDATRDFNRGGALAADAIIPGRVTAMEDKAAATGKVATGPFGSGNFGQQPQTPEQQRETALQIKDPKLRQQALARLDGNSPIAQAKMQFGTNDQGDLIQSKQALLGMLGEVAQKMGINSEVEGQTGLQAITSKLEGTGALQSTGMPGTAGGQQTAAEAFVAFTKGAFTSTGGLTKEGQSWVTDLESAGFLDANANNASPSKEQVQQAYGTALTQAVQNNQSLSQTLQAGQAQATQEANAGPTSETAAFVQGVATEFGVALTPQQITQIANQYESTIAASPTKSPDAVEDQIKDDVVALYNPTDLNNPPGVANTMFTNIQQAALQYQIPISPTQIGQMVKNALQGATVESMYVAADSAQSAATEHFQTQAEGLYPSLAKQISEGQTVQNLVSPYDTITEQYTGVPSSTIMNQRTQGGVNKYDAFLQGGTDPQTGTPTLQTMDQWKKTLMTDPQYGFQKTQGAQDMAEQLSSAVLNELGKVNTNGGSQVPFNAYNPSSALSANTSS